MSPVSCRTCAWRAREVTRAKRAAHAGGDDVLVVKVAGMKGLLGQVQGRGGRGRRVVSLTLNVLYACVVSEVR